ncbi:MAG TPA: cytochrome b N-terminal domain-containing protein [Vicinamibacterales bacterium]|nr:cytochrome b N-terminal domain-containing protein [Vicinamibacterales bacterium]
MSAGDGLTDRLLGWIDARTRYRTVRHVLLDEEIPAGTGWIFTLGSVLLALIAVQLVTGAFLTLYYAPTPDHAYESVRFISSTTPGRLVRGLHHFGASFLVVFLVLHLLRVIVLGSYKPPRELTWLSGLLLLGLVLAFALTGYLLPWDQRAYWATVVTINISKLSPGIGELLAGVLRGGSTIGALTLTRWYSAHVIFLPALLVLLVVAHIVLMRLQGSSGPVRAKRGTPFPFYPYQAFRDTVVVTLVLLAVAGMAWRGMPPLEGPADPTDASYIPRPEWYFLGLFQLLKYFPGKWEVVGAIVIPGIVAAVLALLPWIDRGPEREPRRRPLVMATVTLGMLAVVALTTLGWRDTPVQPSADRWTMREIGGRAIAGYSGCAKCHSLTGMADPLESTALSRGAEWIMSHAIDPEVIAPGVREPPAARSEREVAAMVAYVRKISRQPYPGYPQHIETAATVWARYCVGCHIIDGDGGKDGPELSKAGEKHDVPTLKTWITDPEAVDPDAEMPSFGNRLSAEQLEAIATYLASRK